MVCKVTGFPSHRNQINNHRLGRRRREWSQNLPPTAEMGRSGKWGERKRAGWREQEPERRTTTVTSLSSRGCLHWIDVPLPTRAEALGHLAWSKFFGPWGLGQCFLSPSACSIFSCEPQSRRKGDMASSSRSHGALKEKPSTLAEVRLGRHGQALPSGWHGL